MSYSVSVITPVKQYEEDILQCIKTVKKQNYPYPINHYVITDNIKSFTGLIDSCSNTFIIENNGFGISGARNTGILVSNGEIIFFLDSDDLWPADYISNIINIYNSDKNVGFISAAGYYFETNKFINKLVVPHLYNGAIPSLDVAWNAIGCPSGFSYKITNSTKKCRFNNEINFCEDYLFYLELLSSGVGRFHKTNETFFLYKKSPTQLSKNQSIKNIEKTISVFSRELNKGALSNFSPYLKSIVYIGVRHKASSLFKRINLCPYIFYSTLIIFLRPKIIMAEIRRKLVINKNIDKCQNTIKEHFFYKK